MMRKLNANGFVTPSRRRRHRHNLPAQQFKLIIFCEKTVRSYALDFSDGTAPARQSFSSAGAGALRRECEVFVHGLTYHSHDKSSCRIAVPRLLPLQLIPRPENPPDHREA